ncbi:MAG: substrate-binding domain-containing protein [Candidatus Eremiobacteraeota bacterium]|nr:substrate-binding domain-containing protein [Candidatus Eremiobacteraeota bacterium]MBC5827449.1 substrate-binding domain-containing protein [Candidatus Eremiobacteraeota bacterium]
MASKGLRVIIGLSVASALLCGCSKQSVRAPAAGGSGKMIGVSLLDLEAQFYQAMEASMKTEAAKFGYGISVVDANRDQARQTSQVDDFLSRHVAAVVLSPADSKAVGSAIVEANNSDVPVFTADIASTAAKGLVASHIASDNLQGGKVAADLLGKALHGSGSVAIIDEPEVTSVQDRVRGFKDELSAKFPGIKIVADQTAGGERARASSVADNLLQQYPGLAGIFGINDDSALGALSSVESAGKGGKIKIVGYDANPEAKKAIDAGRMVGDPEQHPDLIGKLTIDAIHDFFDGKKPPKRIPVTVGSYTGRTH